MNQNSQKMRVVLTFDVPQSNILLRAPCGLSVSEYSAWLTEREAELLRSGVPADSVRLSSTYGMCVGIEYSGYPDPRTFSNDLLRNAGFDVSAVSIESAEFVDCDSENA